MPDTVDVRVTDGDVWVDGDHYVRGDEVTIPAGVYERIPESFERVTETCEVIKNDGDVCGRDLPCRFHSDDEDDETEAE